MRIARFLGHLGALASLATALAVGGAPARAADLEKVRYLLPAPLTLPAFGPWVVAKQLGYYKDAGYDVDFVIARGGRCMRGEADRRRQRRHRWGDRRHADPRARQRHSGEGDRPARRRRPDDRHRAARPRHRQDRRPQGQEDQRALLRGHDLLRAPRRAREGRPAQERPRHPGCRTGRRRQPRDDGQCRRLRLHAGLVGRRARRRARGDRHADARLLSLDGAGDRRLRRGDRQEAEDAARHGDGDLARHEVHHGRSGEGCERLRRRDTELRREGSAAHPAISRNM